MLAGNANCSAHEIYQAAAYGKPQSGTSIASRNGRINLVKGLEQAILLVCRNADSGIYHLKLNGCHLAYSTAFDKAYGYSNASAIGKLYGVTHKVNQDLSNTGYIAN